MPGSSWLYTTGADPPGCAGPALDVESNGSGTAKGGVANAHALLDLYF